MFGQILVNGILTGSLYALVALGFSFVFGIARIINMSHTALYMLSGYMMYIFAVWLGLNNVVSFLFAICATVIAAILIYLLLIDKIREHELSVLIMTASVGYIIQEIALRMFGTTFHGIAPFFQGSIEIWGMVAMNQYIFTIVVVIMILVGIWLLFKKTLVGVAIRAVAQDREAASLMGMNIAGIGLLVMIISSALAALAGVLVLPVFGLGPYAWLDLLVATITIVVLGGLGSIWGSVVGAFVLGFVNNFVVFLIPGGAFLKEPIFLFLMVLILLVRPEGLFGVFFEEERL